MKHYVQFETEEALAVINVFSSPQDPEQWPNMGELEDDDPRYFAFLANYPK